jgi:polyhydroxyalkanoate synthesis regulator phasin
MLFVNLFAGASGGVISTKKGGFSAICMRTAKTKTAKPAAAKTAKPPDAEKIAAQIRKVLQAEGVYSKTMELAIESCAQVYYLKNRVFDKIKDRQPTVSEKTREGDKRVKAHPAFAIFQELTEQGRKMLVELCMTVRTSATAADDDVDALTRKVAEVLNE